MTAQLSDIPLQPAGRTRAAPRNPLERKQAALHLAMILPAVALLVLLIGYPLYLMTDIAFRDIKLFQLMQHVEQPVTLKNFERVLGDPRNRRALSTTAIFVGASTALAFAWGLATALLLNLSFRGQRLMRMALVSPWAISSVVASLVWMFLLNGQVGLVNHLLTALGLIEQPINFTVAHPWAMVALIVVTAWKSYPFFTVMLLAGLQAVPRDSLDAARVDGAGALSRFFWVVLPSIRPVIAVTVPLSMLTAFREVETILVLTGGGPARSTETLALSIYNQTFQFFEVGRASALGVLVFALSLVLVLLTLRVLMPRETRR